MFQPLIFEGYIDIYVSFTECFFSPHFPCHPGYFGEKNAEDFLECHLGWGHEKALASALFTALLGTSMGVTHR